MRAPFTSPLIVALALAATACTSTGASESDDATQDAVTPDQSVAVPAERLTPFCQGMIDLADELENDPPDDVEQAIIDAYQAISAEVPEIIRVDFDAVLADLLGEPIETTVTDPPETTTGPTTLVPAPDDTAPPVTDETGATVPADPFADEGRLPGETPAERVNAYVDFACRASQNNPGPPATEPLSTPSTSEG